MTGMIHDIEPNTSPVPATAPDDELDRLATNLLRLSLDGVSLTGNQAASLAYQIIAEGIEFCQCAAPADRVVTDTMREAARRQMIAMGYDFIARDAVAVDAVLQAALHAGADTQGEVS